MLNKLIDVIYNLFVKLFQSRIERDKRSYRYIVQNELYFDQQKRKKESQKIELSRYLGKLVISLGNSGFNIGIATGIELITNNKQPILVINDIITGEEYVCFGKILNFTELRFHALFEMRTVALCSLIWNYTDDFTDPIRTDEEHSEEYKTRMVNKKLYIDVLKNNHGIVIKEWRNGRNYTDGFAEPV